MSCKLMIKTIGLAIGLMLALKLGTRTINAEGAVVRCQEATQTEQDWTERDEFNQSYQLSPGALIEVSMIYGPVDIETSDTNTAEVHIVRSARNREDLASRKISIEHTPTRLLVRGEQDTSQGPAKVRHRVLLKIPVRVELVASRVNGRVNVGEIDGAVRLSRINGSVKIARATGYAEISQINGSLSVALARPGERGVLVKHVNGSVNLLLTDNLNADLKVTEFNGNVSVDMPDLVVMEKSAPRIFQARIGVGGIPISVSDVNGTVWIRRGVSSNQRSNL